jgi:hypothetical protein
MPEFYKFYNIVAILTVKRIHTQKPPQPWIIDPHSIILLIVSTLNLIIILFAIKPIPITNSFAQSITGN